MVNRCLCYKLELPTRDLLLKIKHETGYASVYLDGECVDYGFFLLNKTFTILLSDTFILVKINLTTKGFTYYIDATPCNHIIKLD